MDGFMPIVNVFTITYDESGQIVNLRVREANAVESFQAISSLLSLRYLRSEGRQSAGTASLQVNPDFITGVYDIYFGLRSSTSIDENRRLELQRIAFEGGLFEKPSVFQVIRLGPRNEYPPISIIPPGSNLGFIDDSQSRTKVITYFVDP